MVERVAQAYAGVVGMVSKRSIIVTLVGLNLFLLSLLLTMVLSLPSARAQGSRRGGSLACVSAKPPGWDYDVVFTLDVGAKQLYAVYPRDALAKQLAHTKPRDLLADFVRNR